MGDTDLQELHQTPLFGLHQALGARMVPFAGYSMPVSYPLGVMKEHQHTRAAAGLFDVSHMGQVRLTARSGNVNDAALALERLVPVSVAGLAEGRQRYGFFTNDAGGIIDDLMIARRADHLHLVINASRKAVDLAHMADHLGGTCVLEEITDCGLIALQGPAAAASLSQIASGVADMAFMDVRDVDTGFGSLTVSRSGYTGEDGYEISVPSANALALAQALLAIDAVEAIGLGARDSLRLEAGLCLYGNDIDDGTTPVEAAIGWAIQKVRRADGARGRISRRGDHPAPACHRCRPPARRHLPARPRTDARRHLDFRLRDRHRTGRRSYLGRFWPLGRWPRRHGVCCHRRRRAWHPSLGRGARQTAGGRCRHPSLSPP